MPLGDPHGANFTYTDEGLPENIFMVSVPSSDIRRSVAFYRDIMGLSVVYEKDSEAVVKRGGAIILIRKGNRTGEDTGVFFGVGDPYDLHRRLIDEGIVFIRDPVRGSMGVFTSFLDPDRNILHAIETKAEPRP
ncbi:MAG: VOC family protein [Candidatus Methanoplasma sp.]|jgi:catechol 2,3-dioxygenase-like lactoylglutathione lyase family enzyme|nr:VOC family protein [Candidatus Methanoplasma sp.]